MCIRDRSDGDNIFVDCSSDVVTVTLPASPSIGNQVKIVDGTGSAATNNITVGRNSEKINASPPTFLSKRSASTWGKF